MKLPYNPEDKKSIIEFAKLLKDNSLRQVCDITTIKNDRKGKGHFGQILEGPRAEVTKMWEKIQRDPRHQQVRLLKLEEIEKRSFPAWSMRFFLAKEIIAKMPSLTGVLDGLPEHDVELLRLMRSAAE